MPRPTVYFVSKRPRDSMCHWSHILTLTLQTASMSRYQSNVALSTMDAEYMVAATATQDAFWLQFLLQDMEQNVATPIVMKEDNKTCISSSDHPGNHRNCKHVDYLHHLVWSILKLNFKSLVYSQRHWMRSHSSNSEICL